LSHDDYEPLPFRDPFRTLTLTARGITGEVFMYLSIPAVSRSGNVVSSTQKYYIPLNTTVTYPTDALRIALGEVYVSFTCPALLVKGYATLMLTTLPDDNTTTPVTLMKNDFLYFTDVPCLNSGFYFADGACARCPAGAVCPGGSRLWPRPGFWSLNEYSVPIPCVSVSVFVLFALLFIILILCYSFFCFLLLFPIRSLYPKRVPALSAAQAIPICPLLLVVSRRTAPKDTQATPAPAVKIATTRTA
jgi:hypothetical protein